MAQREQIIRKLRVAARQIEVLEQTRYQGNRLPRDLGIKMRSEMCLGSCLRSGKE